MKVIAIINDKGGAGKTTVTVNLAVAAENHDLPTAVFDLDARANSAVWGDTRNAPLDKGGAGIATPIVVPAQYPRLRLLLDKARQQEADLVIIDTPGNDLASTSKVCEVADFVLVPVKPSPPDLISTVPTVQAALASGKPFSVVINHAPAVGPEVSEARTTIEAAGVSVCPIVLYQRKDYTRRFHEGLTAFETDPEGKAAAEIRALFLWKKKKVGLIASNHAIKAAN